MDRLAITVRDVEQAIEEWAPLDTALPEDPVGHQVGSREASVTAVAVALDPTPTQVQRAVDAGCELLVTHHPLIYRPLRRVEPNDLVGKSAILLCRHEMALYCAHTNWDAAPGGVNDALAEALGVREVRPFGTRSRRDLVKVVTFVPRADVEKLLDALADAGAGQIGLYRRCAFYHSGTGTFEPLPGAHPAIGEVGAREEVDEYRLEMVAPLAIEREVVQALREAHPYEEPAFDVISVRSGPEVYLGRVGELPRAMAANELLDTTRTALRCDARWLGAQKENVRRVAVVGGSGGDFVIDAVEARAEVLITGEVKHHQVLLAWEKGLGVVEATHAATEQPGIEALARKLQQHFGGKIRVECLSLPK